MTTACLPWSAPPTQPLLTSLYSPDRSRREPRASPLRAPPRQSRLLQRQRVVAPLLLPLPLPLPLPLLPLLLLLCGDESVRCGSDSAKVDGKG